MRDLREELGHGSPVPFIGIYDVFSASIAARYYGLLPTEYPTHGISQCTAVLNNNLARRVDRSNLRNPKTA